MGTTNKFETVYAVAVESFPASNLIGEFSNLDKTGTSGVHQKTVVSETFRLQWFMTLDSLESEREGFEPSVWLPRHRFSRPARSAALAPLQCANHTGGSRCCQAAPACGVNAVLHLS